MGQKVTKEGIKTSELLRKRAIYKGKGKRGTTPTV